MSKVKKLEQPKNDQITIFIKEDIMKHYCNLLRSEGEGFKIIKTSKGKKLGKKMPPHVVIELLEDFNTPRKAIKIGAFIEELKYRAAAESQKSKITKKKKEKNLLKLVFQRDVGREFKESYGEELRLDHIVAGTRTSQFLFDVEDCLNRSQLVDRVLAIADAVKDIRSNKRFARDQHYIEEMAHELQNACGYMEKTKEVFVHMDGEELIEKGYATVWDMEGNLSTKMQKAMNWIRGKKKDREYWYLGKLVQPKEKYVVKLHKPENVAKMPMDFLKEMRDRYIFGEQIYVGQGKAMVQRFQNEIVEEHNRMVSGGNPNLPEFKAQPAPPKK